MTDKTCAERVAEELQFLIEDLTKLWELYKQDPEAYDEDLGNIWEYGLSFDYVAPQTFKNQPRGYFRYQLSWGGPSDEFRIYAEGQEYRWIVDHIEYWFLDWFDGACKHLRGDDLRLIKEIFDDFAEVGSCQAEYEKAMADWQPEDDSDDEEDSEVEEE